MGTKSDELTAASVYLITMIFQGPLYAPAVPFVPRPGAPVSTWS